MLKPNKKLTKKELKQDPFLEKVDKIETYFEHNKQKIVQIIIAALVLFFGYKFIDNNNISNNMEANFKLSEAMIAVERGDADNAIVQFESMIQEYANSETEEIGHYYLGKIFFDQQNYQDAENQLRLFVKSSSMDILVPSAYKMLAVISVENGLIDEAISLYEKGKNKSSLGQHSHDLSLCIAKLELKRGNHQKAKTIAEKIVKEEFIVEKAKQMAEELLGQIPG